MSMGKCSVLNLIFKNKLIGMCSQYLLLYKVLPKRGQAMFTTFLTEIFKYRIRKNHFQRWPLYVSFIRAK